MYKECTNSIYESIKNVKTAFHLYSMKIIINSLFYFLVIFKTKSCFKDVYKFF